jgi:hypothetical protein
LQQAVCYGKLFKRQVKMAKTGVQTAQIILSFSPATDEKLQEAARLYGIPAAEIITEIIEESLPKWIQKYHIKHSFSKAAEKVKAAVSPEKVLIKQDELDKVLRLMASKH